MGFKRKHTEKPNDPFYLELVPVLLILRTFARLSYGIKDGRLVSFPRTFVSMVSFLIYAVQFYLAVDVFLITVRRIEEEKSFLMTIMLVIHLILTSIHFYLPFAVVLESGKICSYLNNWADFQDLFFIVTGTRFKPNYRKQLNICLLLSPLLQSVVMLFQHKMKYFQRWYHLSLSFSYILISIVNILFWMISFLEMAHAAHLIKEIIKKYKFQGQSVAKLTLLWITLAKLIEQFSDSMYITMLVFMAVVHTCGVTSAYAVIASINSGYIGDIFVFLVPLTISCILNLVIVEPVHFSKIKVHDEICREIIKIDSKKLDPQTAKQWERFGEVVRNFNAHVTLGGFITIRRNLITSMVGTAVTHLVVLVQFSIRDKKRSSLTIGA